MTSRLIIAAPMSGSGKTTITAGLIAALRRRGQVVQPFKCGPDYIDPGYHSLAAGRLCRNLDTWLLSSADLRTLFVRASDGADLAVIEGVMGLFDGVDALDDTGSTADVARRLVSPVVLVVDARGMARSVAALVQGFARFDDRVHIAGVIFNRVGSPRHAALCTRALEAETGIPTLGYLLRDAALALPERHLGLVTTAESGPWASVIDEVADRLAATCDLDRLLELARSAPPLERLAPLPPPAVANDGGPVIAVAVDAAFSFTYPEMAELLCAAGANVVPFSPLADHTLPPNTAGLILCGGFPELYARQLSQNLALHRAIGAAHEADMPIYAECGGLMFLTEALVDQAGERWPMVGLIPGSSVMTERVELGYRSIRSVAEGPLLPADTMLRGHEFHYSRWHPHPADLPPAYMVLTPHSSDGYPEGYQAGNLVASYIHLHWLSRPTMAEHFVARCRVATGKIHE
ncbi:MAG: cobyrinate a,c-diamide synthase [Herpetosiphon sp.]